MASVTRRPLIVGNWKMNLDRSQAHGLAEGISRESARFEHADAAVCPPFVYLDVVSQAVRGSRLEIGAQDVCYEQNGAYTGEISTSMLIDLGCTYVILGHSERRHIFGETDEVVNKKLLASLTAGLRPIVCVGETLEQRENGTTNQVVSAQFDRSLAGLTEDQMPLVTIAYEPVWAIGTGKVATPEQAEEVHSELRELLTRRYNTTIADSVRIQYGGSVKSSNAQDLLSRPNIDGALVGGASLKVEEFLGIVTAAPK